MFGLIKWTFWISLWVLIAGAFHYTLPQRDIVRIVNTYEERQELGDWTKIFWSTPDDQSAALTSRHVQFIQAVRANGKPIVYRNEDTGWHWPPYFKFDTANLYTEVNDGVSTKADPRWYLLKHYGWRNEFLSIFPNAISVKPIEGPEAPKGLPWLNIFIITIFLTVVYGVWVRWRRFRQARIDPTMEAIEDDLIERRAGVSKWLGSWRRKG